MYICVQNIYSNRLRVFSWSFLFVIKERLIRLQRIDTRHYAIENHAFYFKIRACFIETTPNDWLIVIFSQSVALFSKKKRHPSSLKQQQQQQQQNMRMLLLFFFQSFFFTRHLIIFKHLICDRLGAFNACPMWPPSVRAHVLHWEKSSGIWWNSFARSRFGCYLLRASSMPIPSMTFFFGCYFASQKNAKKNNRSIRCKNMRMLL